MIYNEMKKNLFELKADYFVHCISADYKMGAGIAVQMKKKFNIVGNLKKLDKIVCPDCIKTNEVFNLITKKKYYGKPTYNTLTESLYILESMVEDDVILGMPKIGCGLDKLQWGKVRDIIYDIFKDRNITIIVCYI